MSFKFNIGDEVIAIGNIFSMAGRPTIRTITGRSVKDGKNSYTGHMWRASEDSLIPVANYQWPSEMEMQIQDKRAQEGFRKSFQEIANHHAEEEGFAAACERLANEPEEVWIPRIVKAFGNKEQK